jgi:hypothetical protein
MTMVKILVLGCVLAAVAITLKVRLDTPQGPQPLARAIVTTHLQQLRVSWRCPKCDEQSPLPRNPYREAHGKLDAPAPIRGVSAIAVPSTVVECLVRDEGVAGSNPATPTSFPENQPAFATACATASSMWRGFLPRSGGSPRFAAWPWYSTARRHASRAASFITLVRAWLAQKSANLTNAS